MKLENILRWWVFRDFPDLIFKADIKIDASEKLEKAWGEKLIAWEKEYPKKERLLKVKKDREILLAKVGAKEKDLEKEYEDLRGTPYQERKEIAAQISVLASIKKHLEESTIKTPGFEWLTPLDAIEIKKVGIREYWDKYYHLAE